MSIAGEGKFMIVSNSGVYLPQDVAYLNPEIDNANIIRRSFETIYNKVFPKWTYYNAKAKTKRLSETDITLIRSMTGTIVRLYPNIDVPGISYYVIVKKAEIKIQDKMPWKNYCEFEFIGVYDTDILTTETAKSITVTAPDGTSYIQRNCACYITWTSENFTDNVKIELFKGGVLDSVIAADTDNDGLYVWTVPADQAIGTDYKIKISELSDLYVYNESDEDFGIYYNGYYQTTPSSYIEFPFDELSDDPAWNGDFTIAFEYDPDGVARPDNEYLICSYLSTNYLFRIYTLAGILVVAQINATVPGQTTLSVRSTSTLPTTAGKIKIIITRDFAPHASDVKIYFDNVDDSASVTTNTLDTPTLDTGEPVLFGKYDAGTPLYMDARKVSKLIFSDRIWTAAERAQYQVSSLDCVSDAYAKYPCNEANTFNDPYADFNGTNNYIDTNTNCQNITRMEWVEEYFWDGASTYRMGCRDQDWSGAIDRSLMPSVNSFAVEGTYYLYYGNLSVIVATGLTVGTKYRFIILITSESISFEVLTMAGVQVFYGIKYALNLPTVFLPPYDFYFGVVHYYIANVEQANVYYMTNKFYYLRIDTAGTSEEWYFAPYNQNTIIGNQGTELTINGTTGYFGGDSYADSVIDISGNDRHATPVSINPRTFYNRE